TGTDPRHFSLGISDVISAIPPEAAPKLPNATLYAIGSRGSDQLYSNRFALFITISFVTPTTVIDRADRIRILTE
ncbi:hypothetical protein, partial [Pseudomonas cannabina]|uniref:hypothetical protein n=1 Tax=Pseudomonas cannabina TaxID=86840 RepID=UPI001C81FCC7